MKTHINLTVDTELLLQSKNFITNLSGEFQEFLRLVINQNQKNGNSINLIQLKKEHNKKNQELQELTIEVEFLQKQIINCEEKIHQAEQKRLQKEKEKAEKVLKCVLCGGYIEGHNKELAYSKDGKDYFHHTNCFYDKLKQHRWAKKEEYVKWLKKQNDN